MRILLVEDEEKVARLVKRGLKEEGFNIDVAGDPHVIRWFYHALSDTLASVVRQPQSLKL